MRNILYFIFIVVISGCAKGISISSKNPTILSVAKSKLGSPYSYGKAGEYSFDCSGFVYYVYKKNGYHIPRTSKAQSQMSQKKIFSKRALKPGDILFFDTSDRGYVNHSGIYLGEMKFIHASSGKAHSVTISRLDRGFYKDRFLWGIRVIKP